MDLRGPRLEVAMTRIDFMTNLVPSIYFDEVS